MLVNGSTKNRASKAAFRATTGSHLRCIRKPTETTATRSGTKSPNPKRVGKFVALPKPIAPKFPIKTINPPKYGPKRMPIIGARKSENERYPPVAPISMLNGMNRRRMYNALKIARRAICLVLWLLRLGLLAGPIKF